MTERDDGRMRGEVMRLQALTDDEIYALLVQGDDEALYSLRGRVIEGKRRFSAALLDAKSQLCAIYHKIGKHSEAINLIIGLATELEKVAPPLGIPITPLCVLAVRGGMGALCGGIGND